MHKLTCCYKEKACDKCVINANRKFCFIEATQTVFDNLLRCQLQHLFRLAVAVYRFTCFCRAILPIPKLSDKLFAFVILLIFLFTLLSILRIMVSELELLSVLGNWYPDRLHPDHRPQLVQPRVAESLSKVTEVLYPENLSCGFLLLPDLPLHHPQKPVAYPNAE